MFNEDQLKFIRGSLTAPNAAIPCSDGGKTARLFLSTLDVIDSQLKEAQFRAAIPPLRAVDNGPTG